MTTFIEGTCTGALTGVELSRLGGVLANVHTSGVPCEVGPTNRMTDEDLAWLMEARRDQFADWALTQHSKSGGFGPTSNARVPTHGDPFRDNIVIGPDGSLTLIDWEDAANDLPEIDLGIAVLAHCNRNGLDAALAQCLLSGYHCHGGSREVSLDSVLRTAAYTGLVLAYRRYRRELEGIALPESHQLLKAMVTSIDERLEAL